MDEFTFKSDAFKSAIMAIIVVFLGWNVFTLVKVLQGELYLLDNSPLWYLAVAVGLLLKIAILVSSLSMKGPLRSLLYLYGGLLVIGGLAHFLSAWTGGINPASLDSIYSLVMVSTGFVLALPAGHAIQYAYDP